MVRKGGRVAVSVCWVGVVAATDRETSTICSSERVMCALTKAFFKLGCLRAMNLGCSVEY